MILDAEGEPHEAIPHALARGDGGGTPPELSFMRSAQLEGTSSPPAKVMPCLRCAEVPPREVVTAQLSALLHPLSSSAEDSAAPAPPKVRTSPANRSAATYRAKGSYRAY